MAQVSAPGADASPEPPSSAGGASEPTDAPAPQPGAPADTVPAGWYEDPSGGPRPRWWDGTAWTDHTSA